MEEADKYLLEINLEDLETTSGKTQEYWLLSIRTAREYQRLRAVALNRNAEQRSQDGGA